jgi:hypothetical protein
MSANIITFPPRLAPHDFAEFPDGYDAAIIFCALVEARDGGDRDQDVEAILDWIFNVEQNQTIEWRVAFHAGLENKERP